MLDLDLLNAITAGNLELVQKLAVEGVDLNAVTSDGNAPIHFASYNGDLHLVKYLVEVGADINRANNQGNTPIHMAADQNHLDLVKYLVAQNAQVNIENKEGLTPLTAAIFRQYRDVIIFLCEDELDLVEDAYCLHISDAQLKDSWWLTTPTWMRNVCTNYIEPLPSRLENIAYATARAVDLENVLFYKSSSTDPHSCDIFLKRIGLSDSAIKWGLDGLYEPGTYKASNRSALVFKTTLYHELF